MHGGGFHSVQIAAGYDVEYGVTVTLEAQNLFLSPEQARAAGLALLSAASWAKDHSVT